MNSPLSFLSRWMNRSERRAPRRDHRRRPMLEALEDRTVPAGFNFTDFSDASALTLVGDASIASADQLRLAPSDGGLGGGAAWYSAEQMVVDAGFETSFQFALTNPTVGGSDGFVFVVQNTSSTFLGSGSGLLGYEGLTNSVAIEFDTHANPEYGDPSVASHISVHTNGTGANSASESMSLGSYTPPGMLDDGAVHDVRIVYIAGTLSIYLDDDPANVLSVAVDLAGSLGLNDGRAWVGFTAGIGGGTQNHDILNWSYTTLEDVATTVSIQDVSAVEGDSGSVNYMFTVTRAGDTTGTTTVNWATQNGTAVAGSDYTAASGQVVFDPGVTQQTVTVAVAGDTLVEQHESFVVFLSGATGGFIADGAAVGTILTNDVAVSIGDSSAIVEGDTTIKSLGALVAEGLDGHPRHMIFGPDGNLYVTIYDTGAVYRYDAATGSPLPAPDKTGAVFVSPGSGGLALAQDLAFGPDGFLYVVSQGTDAVLRYDPDTGEFAGELVASGAGGLDLPRGVTFHDGYVYVTSVGTETASDGKDSVLRFDAETGAPAGVSGMAGDAVFIASGSGGLNNPSRVVFGPDGKAYVSSTGGTSVLRYDSVTGAPSGVSGQSGDAVFVSPGSGGLDGPVDMVFRPDGYLYVTSWRNDAVLRYDSSTGAFVSTVVSSGSGGLDIPIALVFEPDGNFLVSSYYNEQIIRYGVGSQAAFTVSLSSASALPVTVDYITAAGTAAAGRDFTTTSGTVSFAPGETTKTILVKTIDNTAIELDETFAVNLSNPVGAVIADGSGVGTIRDNDTKFYVVNDATTNLTYEYGNSGTAGQSYALNSGNTAPRGAASNAAGDTVWVVDANKNVYVYNTSGGLLGSWTAGSLNGAAQLEGIATNGTDIWLVDGKQDKVFKYTGAASRLSGSQNAASSFNLNSGNKDAKDIVTDGTYLWVVNDSSSDKVFKYSLSGTLAGSWTITNAGTQPTGITLDPTDPKHIWIVDAGADRIYQFDNAVSITSGSKAANSTSFALASGNSNPQGIADPPTSAAPPAVSSAWELPNQTNAVDRLFEAPRFWGRNLHRDAFLALAGVEPLKQGRK